MLVEPVTGIIVISFLVIASIVRKNAHRKKKGDPADHTLPRGGDAPGPFTLTMAAFP
jgi:hypothetical protein